HPAVIGPVVAAAVPRDAIVGPHEGDRAGRGRYREPGHRVLEADSRRTVRRILQEPTLVVDHLGAERSPVRIPPFEDLPARFLAILDHHGAPADRVVAVTAGVVPPLARPGPEERGAGEGARGGAV